MFTKQLHFYYGKFRVIGENNFLFARKEPDFSTLTFLSSYVVSECLEFADLLSTSSLAGSTDPFMHELERTFTSDVTFYRRTDAFSFYLKPDVGRDCNKYAIAYATKHITIYTQVTFTKKTFTKRVM